MSQYDVLFSRTFNPRTETFGDFLTKILNPKNRLPVDEYRVSYETEPFVLRKAKRGSGEKDVTARQEHVETGPLTIQVSDLIIPGSGKHYTFLGYPLTRDENELPIVLSTETEPEIVTSTNLDDPDYISGEVYREILVSVNDTVIGHFIENKDFPDENDPNFQKVAEWIGDKIIPYLVSINEALSSLSIAENMLPNDSLIKNIPRSRAGRLALLNKLKGLEWAKSPDAKYFGDSLKDIAHTVKIEAFSKSYKETPNEIELREAEEVFRREFKDAGKGAGYSEEELEKQQEAEDYFASRREQLRHYQEAGQTTYEEYMRNYGKKIEQNLYEGLLEGMGDLDSVPYGENDPVPTELALRRQAQDQAQYGIDQIRKRRLPGDKEEERDEKRLKAEARMALMETKGDVRAAARLIRKWRASVGQKPFE